MEECDNCLDWRRWRWRVEFGAKVEKEGLMVPTRKSSREERHVVERPVVECWLRGVVRRAFVYIEDLYTFAGDNKIIVISV
jgi:hypothetical protein